MSMKLWRIGVFLLLAGVASLVAQEQPPLWIPQGYRLLSDTERQTLSSEELKSIAARNSELLRDAVNGLTLEERKAVLENLDRAKQDPERTLAEKHYATMVSMALLSAGLQQHVQEEKDAEKAKFERLSRDQEEKTKGFPSDLKSVQAEAEEIQRLLEQGQKDRGAIYLRIVRLLRARPWNGLATFHFRRFLLSDSLDWTNLGLRFLHARQAEDPNQGTWYSLEACLQLRHGEVAHAKRLFAIADARHARDDESRIFPLLIAEVEQNQTEIVRLRARAAKDLEKGFDLDRALLDGLQWVSADFAAKAARTFLTKYKQARPTDWKSRTWILAGRIHQKLFRNVEQETASLLALPLAVLPEPYRTEFVALNLQAKAGLGHCGEVTPQLANFETGAERVYPRESDPDAPPRPRTAKDVQRWRASLEEDRRGLAELKKSLDDGSFDRAPEFKGVSKDEIRQYLAESSAELERESAEAMAIFAGRDDASAAAEWKRRELAEWEKAHDIWSEQASYRFSPRAESLSIAVRSALGRCLLEAGQPLESARMLKPCVGGGRNFHSDCIHPLVEAGVVLARGGNVAEASAIYGLVSPSFVGTDKLYEAIEEAAPGTVKRWTPRD